MAIRATKLGSAEAVKRSLKGGKGFLFRPQDGSTTVRFLTEPDQWVQYWEVFDEDRGHYVPLEDGENDDDAKKRYLTNAFLEDEQRVIPLVLPASAVSSLMKKYDRYGTLLDREYIIDRSGTGWDTEYDVDSGSKSKFNVARYEDELIDLLDLLEAQLDDDGGAYDDDDDDDDDEDEKPSRRSSTNKRRPVKKTTSSRKPKKRTASSKGSSKGSSTKGKKPLPKKKARKRR